MSTIQLNSGDAGRAESMSDKKWNKELEDYRTARAEGIQPAGTTAKHVREARQASEKLGRAYDAGSMPAANRITEKTAAVMNYIDLGK